MSVSIYATRGMKIIEGAPGMNLANGNFRTLWNALGLDTGDCDLCGSMSPKDLCVAIVDAVPELAIRADRDGTSDEIFGCPFYEMGIDRERIDRYLDGLRRLAVWAVAHDATITWA